MSKSPVPLLPFRQSAFYKAQARRASTAKLKRLRVYLVLDQVRRQFNSKDPFDLALTLLTLLLLVMCAGEPMGFIGKFTILKVFSLCLVVLGCTYLAFYAAQKLGFIDLVFLRKGGSAAKTADLDEGQFVYQHQKPETQMNETAAAEAALTPKSGEPHQDAASDDAVGSLEWRVVVNPNGGAVRYRVPGFEKQDPATSDNDPR